MYENREHRSRFFYRIRIRPSLPVWLSSLFSWPFSLGWPVESSVMSGIEVSTLGSGILVSMLGSIGGAVVGTVVGALVGAVVAGTVVGAVVAGMGSLA